MLFHQNTQAPLAAFGKNQVRSENKKKTTKTKNQALLVDLGKKSGAPGEHPALLADLGKNQVLSEAETKTKKTNKQKNKTKTNQALRAAQKNKKQKQKHPYHYPPLDEQCVGGGRRRPRRRAQPFTKTAGSELHGVLPTRALPTRVPHTDPVTAWAEAWMGKEPRRREGEFARHMASDSQISPKGRQHT